MQNERQRAVIVFLLCAACALVPALVAVLTEDKLAMHAEINSRHYPLTDLFFRYFTHLGDGIVPTIIALFLLAFRSWRHFLMVGCSAAFSAIVAQLLKHAFFADADRPSMFFDRMPGIRTVEGLDLYQHFSFPSGHTTSAFATALALTVLIGSQRAAFTLALLASALGFSRIYLRQHFTVDALGGAMIGTMTALAVWWWLYRSSFSAKAWLDRRPFRQNQYLPPMPQSTSNQVEGMRSSVGTTSKNTSTGAPSNR
jgi:membrane-associated phospholipid phosphatase